MAFRIGFATGENKYIKPAESELTTPQLKTEPRKSVVQVYFEDRHITLAYYNDQFDLHRGDIVFVDGKLSGLRGRVREVNYNFKIKLSDYKRVIAVADTSVNGTFFMAGSHFVTFDPSALPVSKAVTWFRPPVNDDDEFVCGNDGTSFCLNDLKGMDIGPAIAERGHNYYIQNKVRYICINGSDGYAVVEGSEMYEVEFEYRNGEISNLCCTCPCSYNCKHEFAAMLQLKETLENIETHYSDEYERTDYFAAVSKGTMFEFIIDSKEKGTFSL